MTALQVMRLRCEHLTDPLGIDALPPRLSWQVSSTRRGARQAAYQLRVASSPQLLAAGVGDLWDTGRVESDDSVLVPYEGVPMRSRQGARWAVRVWDDQDRLSAWSAPGRWEMGLLDPADWTAQWIAAPAGQRASGAVSYLRSPLTLEGTVHRARAYATALGLYELHCNGRRVGERRFTPGWTDYAQRLHYQVYDLTDLLRPGDNVLGAVLAEGWYAGCVGFQGGRAHYGDTPQLLVQVEVDTGQGQVRHVTGPGWTAGTGAAVSSDLLQGERVDGCRDDPAWCTVQGLSTDWPAALPGEGTAAARVLSPAPPVRVLQERIPATVRRLGPDSHQIDLGQNITGWLRLRLAGESGTEVHVRHAEVLDEQGRLYTASLRGAAAEESYLLAGKVRNYEPSFTFHGFRYAEIRGYPGELSIADVTGVVCGSDLDPTGTFSCSDARIEQLHSNIVWSARGNFLEIPTDCPQRDERLGWTGDAQVFAPTACYLFETTPFYAKWLRDLRDTQTERGSFADVAPRVLLAPEGSAGWADAGVLVPWTVYCASGDRQLLAESYPAMRRWISYVERANPQLLWQHARGYDNGDWLAPGPPTDKELIATAFFARSASVTALVAEELGLAGDAKELHDLADDIRAAFCAAYLGADGELSSPTQTAYALALRFDLLPAAARAAAGRRLVAAVQEAGERLTTGFLGVAHLLPALSDVGRPDLAYRILLAEGYPSWLHSVLAGATTVWERWDGWTADAGFQDPEMNSFNHYAYGAVGEWLYSTASGIQFATPGGRQLHLAPVPDAALEHVRARILSPQGSVACGWQRGVDGELLVSVEVPVGATAQVVLPIELDQQACELGVPVGEVPDVTVVEHSAHRLILAVGSGTYTFQIASSSTQLSSATRRGHHHAHL